MNVSRVLAKHFKDVNNGGNWTAVNIKEVLTDVTWEQATQKVSNLNTIYTLAYHINYYVELQLRVFHGGPIIGTDKESFETPLITSQKEWEDFLRIFYGNASAMTTAIEALDNEQLEAIFGDTEKFGTNYRNIQGMIEHHHYHLGQIVLLKKLVGSETL